MASHDGKSLVINRQKFSLIALGLVALALVLIGLYLIFRSHAVASADLNGDHTVDILDQSILAAHFGLSGMTRAQGDLTGDGNVTIADESILAAQWHTSTASYPPVTGKNMFGIATGSKGFPGSSPTARATFDSQLADMQTLGVHWIRLTLPWSNVEGTEGTWKYGDVDYVANELHKYNIRVIITLNNAPNWSAGNIKSDPVAAGDPTYGCGGIGTNGGITFSISDYATYAEKLAEHFSNFTTSDGGTFHVDAWEMGNEPNHNKQMFLPPNSCQYTKLMHETYAKVHAADPTAIIMNGGFGGVSENGGDIRSDLFFQQVYAENQTLYGVSVPNQCGGGQVGGSAGLFDAVAYHPYSRARLPAEDAIGAGPGKNNAGWYYMVADTPTVTGIRPTMVCHGDSAKKVWITEYGGTSWPTNQNDFIGLPGIPSLTDGHYQTLVCNLLPPSYNATTLAYPDPKPTIPSGYPACSTIYDSGSGKLLPGHSDVDMLNNAYATFAGYDWSAVLCWFDYQEDTSPEDSFIGPADNAVYNNGDFRGLRDFNGNKKPLWQAYKDAVSAAP